VEEVTIMPTLQEELNQLGTNAPKSIDKLQVIKELEGFSPKAHWDFKQHSVGYGTKANSPTEQLTKEQAEVRLREHVEKAVDPVIDRAIKVPLTDKQRAAVTSLIYNVGSNAFEKSKFLKKLNAGDLEGAAGELDDWTKAGGQVQPGLVKRRQKEKTMFLEGIQNKVPGV
jgi:lysozyme